MLVICFSKEIRNSLSDPLLCLSMLSSQGITEKMKAGYANMFKERKLLITMSRADPEAIHN